MTEWIAGLCGGSAGVLVGHPFDTIKVKLQTQDFKNPKYRGTWDCFIKSAKKDGPKGLYKGMASPLAGVGVINAVIFGVQGSVTRLFKDPTALSSQFIGGISAGFVQAFVVSPVELAKTRLQLQADALSSGKVTSARYQGCFDCIKKIYKTEGVKGVFRGQAITIVREVPSFGVYFLGFELFHRSLNDACGPSMLSTLIAGGFAGIASWTVCYPVDVIKTRLQSDGAFSREQYKGIFDCFRQSVKAEGYGALAKGLTPTVIRAFPSNAACFYVVTSVTKLIDGDTINDESMSMETFKRIVSSGDTILNAANAGQQILSYQNECVKKVIFNHASNYLPAVQQSIRNKTSFTINLPSVGTEFFDYYCKKFTILTINEISNLLWL